MAGRFSRRVHAYARRRGIPLRHCEPTCANTSWPSSTDPRTQTLPGVPDSGREGHGARLGGEHKRSRRPHLTRKTPWPYVNHFHFHIIDKDWGHLTFKLSGDPPFGLQVMLNGHEWLERRAGQKTIPTVLFILREKVIKPVLAGAGRPKPGRPPKRIHPLDTHYENLQRELRRTFDTLGLAA